MEMRFMSSLQLADMLLGCSPPLPPIFSLQFLIPNNGEGDRAMLGGGA